MSTELRTHWTNLRLYSNLNFIGGTEHRKINLLNNLELDRLRDWRDEKTPFGATWGIYQPPIARDLWNGSYIFDDDNRGSRAHKSWGYQHSEVDWRGLDEVFAAVMETENQRLIVKIEWLTKTLRDNINRGVGGVSQPGWLSFDELDSRC